MVEAPAVGTGADTVLNFKRVAEVEELRSCARGRLQALPIPQVVAH